LYYLTKYLLNKSKHYSSVLFEPTLKTPKPLKIYHQPLYIKILQVSIFLIV
jgi:hypothetical protein